MVQDVESDKDNKNIKAQLGITSDNVFVAKSFKKPSLLKKIYLVVGLLAVGMVVIFSVLYFQNKNRTVAICSNSLLNKAQLEISQSNFTELKGLVGEIQSHNNYQKDPNCLYPIASYYINISDLNNSKIYMDKLETVYNSKKGLSPIYAQDPTVTQLKSQYNLLNQATIDNSKNVTLFNFPNQ